MPQCIRRGNGAHQFRAGLGLEIHCVRFPEQVTSARPGARSSAMAPADVPGNVVLGGTPSVREFAELYNQGHRVHRRQFLFEDGVVAARLFLAQGEEKLTLAGHDQEFLRLALAFVRFPIGEVPLDFVPGTKVQVVAPQADSPLRASPECRITWKGIPLTTFKRVLVEDAGKTVSARIWLPAKVSSDANPASARADLEIRYGLKEGITHLFHGFVHSIVPFTEGTEELIQVDGQDSLGGNPTIVEAMFNFKVDPGFGIAALVGFADLGLLFEQPCDHPDLAIARSAFPTNEARTDPEQVLDALRRIRRDGDDAVTKSLAEAFERSGVEPRTAPVSVRAFLNALELRLRKANLVLVVGCIENLRAEGIAEVGRNVIVAAPDHIPFRLKGRETEQLCRQWDGESARIVTFVKASDAPDSKQAAAVALRDAADWLMLALSDSSWWHKLHPGPMQLFPVDARTQAGRFALNPYYHWHYLFGGTASQHRYGTRRMTDIALLDPVVHAALSAREPILHFLQEHRARVTSPEAHGKIRSAVEWIVRSRTSLSREEEFLCLWIALEFLVTPGSGEKEESIKGALHARVAGLLSIGRDGGTAARGLWSRRIDEWYRIRNSLVHDGGTGVDDVGKHIPDIRHAAISVIIYLVGALQSGSDHSIGDVLDAHRRRPPRQPGAQIAGA